MHWQGRYRRVLSVWLAVTVWVAIGLVVPVATIFNSADIGVQDSVVAASRDMFVIDRPVVLAQMPGVHVTRGTIVRVLAQGSAASAAAPTQQAKSNRSLALENAHIAVGFVPSPAKRQEAASAGVADEDEAVLVTALAGAEFEVLTLKRSSIAMRLAGANAEPITHVDAVVQLKRKNVVAIKGTGRLRGQKVSFDLMIGGTTLAREAGQPLSLPVKIEFKSDIAEGSFEGKLEAGKEIELRGQGELSVTSGRQLARWFGAYWLAGSGLRDIKAKGTITLGKGVIAFDKADFSMDGNQATGALALRFSTPRPELTGTLAVKKLDATRYLGATSEGSRGTKREGVSWASLSAGALTVPLGMHLDADVRISADVLKCGSMEFVDTAAAIALKDGRLLADFAELKFAGGSGGGQIVADFIGFVPKVVVRGKLENIDLGQITKMIGGHAIVQAPGTVVADLTSNGFTLQDLMGGLSGKLSVSSAGSGRLGVDLAKLGKSSTSVGASGWGVAGKGTTTFDALDLKLVLRDGVMLTEVAEARSGKDGWSASGLLNLPASRLDIRLSHLSSSAGPLKNATKAQATSAQKVLEVRGPLEAPVISILPEPGIATGTSVGGGLRP